MRAKQRKMQPSRRPWHTALLFLLTGLLLNGCAFYSRVDNTDIEVPRPIEEVDEL